MLPEGNLEVSESDQGRQIVSSHLLGESKTTELSEFVKVVMEKNKVRELSSSTLWSEFLANRSYSRTISLFWAILNSEYSARYSEGHHQKPLPLTKV
jgi:uncharacterized protein YjfI (DUF2170 family)